jgi:hypothetical protein
MDFWQALRELRKHRNDIDSAIANLERLIGSRGATKTSRRGRKNMPEEERRIVSERMRKYWANRRRQREQASNS